MQPYANIAVIKSGAIGDVLMTTPFLKGLRKAFPRAKITYVVGEWSKAALEGNPNVDRIMPFDHDIIFRGNIISRLRGMLSLSSALRKEKFDLCFVMDKSWLAGLFAFFCGIPERAGFARGSMGWEGFALTKKVKYEKVKHEIQYYLDLLVYFTKEKFSSNMELFISEKDRKFAAKLAAWKGRKKLVGISVAGGNPGQSSARRDWPETNFKKLGEMISAKGWLVAVLGTSRAPGMKNRHVCDLAGKTMLKEAAAAIEACDAFVSADTGLMHVAGAVATPCVSIFGPTDPRRKAPMQKNSVYLWKGSACGKCELYGKYCSRHPSTAEITPEDVMQELERIL